MFFRIGVLKNFALFTGKHLCWSLFLIKFPAWRPFALLIRLQHRCFPVKFTKFLRTTFFDRTPTVAASGNMLWTLSFFHMRTINSVISWYVLTLQRLFHFIACVSFLPIFFLFFFLIFLWILLLAEVLGKVLHLPLRITCSRVSPWNLHINFYISLMATCSLDALKEPSKNKETRIKKEIVEVLKQASYRKKRTGN